MGKRLQKSIEKQTMTKYTLHILAIPILLTLCTCFSYAFNIEYLPRKFLVYRNEAGIVQQRPEAGFIAKYIPNVNLFINSPGCYIACYSSSPNNAVYPVSPDAYLIGQIRVEGKYQGQICYPKDVTQTIFNNDPTLTTLCSKTFKCIGDSCWAGGTTGQWFGLK